MPIELSTVADDHAVLHESAKVHRFDELKPDSDYVLAGVNVHTLPRPPGEHLTTFRDRQRCPLRGDRMRRHRGLRRRTCALRFAW